MSTNEKRQEFEEKSGKEEVTRIKILLGVTGSVAAIKVAKISRELTSQRIKVKVKGGSEDPTFKTIVYEVRIVVTARSCEFLNMEELRNAGIEHIYKDEDEWGQWKKIGDPVLHIDLRNWADIFVIAPLTANTLAKMSLGLCDNLLTCIVKAWEYEKKALFVAPAMNTKMWNNFRTQEHLVVIRDKLGIGIIDPVEKILACGEKGVGAMAHVDTIVQILERKVVEKVIDTKK